MMMDKQQVNTVAEYAGSLCWGRQETQQTFTIWKRYNPTEHTKSIWSQTASYLAGKLHISRVAPSCLFSHYWVCILCNMCGTKCHFIFSFIYLKALMPLPCPGTNHYAIFLRRATTYWFKNKWWLQKTFIKMIEGSLFNLNITSWKPTIEVVFMWTTNSLYFQCESSKHICMYPWVLTNMLNPLLLIVHI